MPEFGAGSHTFNTVFGVTRNPYDLGRSAGGSSGGGAAALTSGMVAVADGSDYGGSVRNPPNFNSVVGLRPHARARAQGSRGRPVGDAQRTRSHGPHRGRRRAAAERDRRTGPPRPHGHLRVPRVVRRRCAGRPQGLPGRLQPRPRDAAGGTGRDRGDRTRLAPARRPRLRRGTGAPRPFRRRGSVRRNPRPALRRRSRRYPARPSCAAQGHGDLEHRARLGADRGTGDSRPPPACRAVPAHERFPGTVRRIDPAGVAGSAVPGRGRLGARHQWRTDGDLHRLDAELLADHHDLPPGAVACRAASPRTVCRWAPRSSAATAARPSLLAFAAAWEAALDVASRRPALAHAETGVRPDRTAGGPTAIKELENQWRPD